VKKKTAGQRRHGDAQRRDDSLLAGRQRSSGEQAVLVSVRFKRDLRLTASQRQARALAVLTGEASDEQHQR
jgi:hypothetical protein